MSFYFKELHLTTILTADGGSRIQTVQYFTDLRFDLLNIWYGPKISRCIDLGSYKIELPQGGTPLHCHNLRQTLPDPPTYLFGLVGDFSFGMKNREIRVNISGSLAEE